MSRSLDTATLAFIAGGGQMGELTRGFDWSTTPVGPVSQWPQSLKTIVRTMLDSRYAMWLGWGPQLTFFYNDAYAQMSLGSKHPWALGRSAREVWAEIWPDIGPRAQSVLDTGQATWDEGLLLFLERNGFREETYHTFSYSPVPDDRGGVGGLLCVVTEDTERTIGERRLRTLRELAARTTDEAKSVEEASQTAARILGANPKDVPFALLYLLDADGRRVSLAGASGVAPDTPVSPSTVDLAQHDAPWPLKEVAESGQAAIVANLPGQLPGGPWPEPASRALVLPMAKPGQAQLAGFVVAGISSRRPLDDGYRGFLELLAGQVATAVANARAYEEERRRAEALAKLDRSKTAFFSNVSHEFRTPLTLMLGPVADLLSLPEQRLLAEDRERLELVHRNGLRLQRLVNTLLDFSRIEAGRVQARYEPTELAAFTADLASNFRSACERAGLELKVDCPAASEPVYVDRQMWEKIVFNLLSNAFKFTFEGSITVRLRLDADEAQLQVSDTGTGIPAEDLPRLFVRFHRIENARGRTHEGSGIGLALVQELVKLHGGSITAESEEGRGTTFLVKIPLGASHLPRELLSTDGSPLRSAASANPFLEETLHWLPEAHAARADGREPQPSDSTPVPSLPHSPATAPLVLVADDNTDMRQYICRLLMDQYRIEAVGDGAAALAAVRKHAPDIILSDVMMPHLDGFSLLKELRADPRTAGIPVILLSARAGEDSRVEGMQAGADDYLVKPFSARELLARVSAHLQMARLRRDANASLRASEDRFRTFMDHSPANAYVKDAAGRYLFVNRAVEQQFNRPQSEWIGKTDFDLFSHEEASHVRENDIQVLQSKKTARFEETSTQADGPHYYMSFKFPLQSREGSWLLAGMSLDITDQKRAVEAQQRLAAIVESSHDAIISKDLSGIITSWNSGAERLYGYRADEIIGQHVSLIIPPERRGDLPSIIAKLQSGERIEDFETVRMAKDGRRLDVSLTISPVRNAEGKVIGASKIARDITERKRAEAAVRLSEERLAAELEAMSRLHALSSRLMMADNLTEALEDVLENAIATCGADFGNIQLLNHQSGQLEIVAQRGFQDEFLEQFGLVTPKEGSACDESLQNGESVVMVDVQRDLTNEPDRRAAAAAGYRAVHSTPLKTHDGAIVGVLWTHFRLPHRVSQRDRRLLDLYARHAADLIERHRYERALRDADQRKDEFLATLAHELRNPLAPLRNGLQIMKLAGSEPQAAEQARTMMERQLEQMIHLVDDLLDLSRISRGKIELRKERVELASIIRHASETSRPVIEASNHEFSITLPPGPIYVEADVTRLAQVFSNLLNNAAKYTEPGGRIHLNIQRHDGQAVISVCDNGIGIPESMLPHVFDMFTQVDRNLERAQGGLGIGLSIVRRLVEMHGGSVEARSAGSGLGSEFVVRLPVISTVDPPHRHNGEADKSSTRFRILVVDDNKDAALSLALVLKLMGNETKTAHDGLEALQAAAGFRPELVLLDIGMPRLNGYDTAKRIRQEPWGKGVTLVALTGWGQEEDRRRSKDAGFDSHITKPIEPAALEQLLAKMKSA
ncbi:MAG: ATP-binding protein [Aureliella sp.]